jgi:hypothetical protein
MIMALPSLEELHQRHRLALQAEQDARANLKTVQIMAALEAEDVAEHPQVLEAQVTLDKASDRVVAIALALAEVTRQVQGKRQRLQEAARDAEDLAFMNSMDALDKAAQRCERVIAEYTASYEALRHAGAQAQNQIFLMSQRGDLRSDLAIPDCGHLFEEELARAGAAPGHDKIYRSLGGISGAPPSLSGEITGRTTFARQDLAQAKARRAPFNGEGIDDWAVGGTAVSLPAPIPEPTHSYGTAGRPLSPDQAGPLATGGE